MSGESPRFVLTSTVDTDTTASEQLLRRYVADDIELQNFDLDFEDDEATQQVALRETENHSSSARQSPEHSMNEEDDEMENGANEVNGINGVNGTNEANGAHTTNGSSANNQQDQAPAQAKDANLPWWHNLLFTEDWMSVWIGFLCIILATVAIAFTNLSHPPEPTKWFHDASKAFDPEIWIGMAGMILATALLIAGAIYVLDRSDVRPFFLSFAVVAAIAVISLFVGHQVDLAHAGLGYAFWTTFFGIVISNGAYLLKWNIDWLVVPQRPEFYIRIALVTLGIHFQTILKIAGPGFMLSWIKCPIVLSVGYWFGTRVLRIPNKSLVMTIACGATICGPSAATAASASSNGSKQDLMLAICVLTAFTTIFLVIMPLIVNFSGMNDVLGGAWIGATVDTTGAVVAAADSVSITARQVASTVKIIQNAMIGVLALGISYYWILFEERSSGSKRSAAKKSPSLWILWKKFPKFVIGFMVASLYFTFLLEPMIGTEKMQRVVSFCAVNSSWWFAIAFVGIGLATNAQTLRGRLIGGKVVWTYLFAQGFDVLFCLGMTYLSFGGILLPRPDISN